MASLTLGGYDAARFTPSNFSIPFASDDSRSLTVGVQSISATNTISGVVAPLDKGILALIDSSVPDIWLPDPVCQAFEQAFGLIYDRNTDLYIVNDTMHSRLQQVSPTVTIKVGAVVSGGPSVDIILPYDAFDLQANHPLYPNATNYFPLRRAANSSQYTLGRTFLQEAYIIADYERLNLTVAQATFENPVSARIIPILPTGYANDTQSNEKPSKHLASGPIAGIAIGSVTLIALLVALTILVRQSKCRWKQQSDTIRRETDLANDNAYSSIPNWNLELPESQAPRAPQELEDSSIPTQVQELAAGLPISELDVRKD